MNGVQLTWRCFVSKVIKLHEVSLLPKLVELNVSLKWSLQRV